MRGNPDVGRELSVPARPCRASRAWSGRAGTDRRTGRSWSAPRRCARRRRCSTRPSSGCAHPSRLRRRRRRVLGQAGPQRLARRPARRRTRRCGRIGCGRSAFPSRKRTTCTIAVAVERVVQPHRRVHRVLGVAQVHAVEIGGQLADHVAVVGACVRRSAGATARCDTGDRRRRAGWTARVRGPRCPSCSRRSHRTKVAHVVALPPMFRVATVRASSTW